MRLLLLNWLGGRPGKGKEGKWSPGQYELWEIWPEGFSESEIAGLEAAWEKRRAKHEHSQLLGAMR